MSLLDFGTSPILRGARRALHFADTAMSAMMGQTAGREHYSISAYNPTIDIWGHLPDPDEVKQKHGTGEPRKFYAEVRRTDAGLAALFEIRKTNSGAVPWDVVPGDAEDDLSVAVARQFRTSFERCRFRSVSMHAWLDAIADGVAFVEPVWSPEPREIEPGTFLWIPESLIDRPAERFSFAPDRTPLFVGMRAGLTGEPVPAHQIMVLTCGSADTPWGKGVMQDLYANAWLKKEIKKWGVRAVQRDGEPLVIVWYPSDFDEDDRRKLEQSIRATYRNYILLPSDGAMKPEIEIKPERGGTAGESQQRWMDRLDTADALLVLGGQMSTGRQSFSTNASDVAKDTKGEEKAAIDTGAMKDAIESSLLKSFVDINYPGLPLRLRPRLEYDTKIASDLIELSSRLEKAKSLGVTLDMEWAARELRVRQRESGEPSSLQKDQIDSILTVAGQLSEGKISEDLATTLLIGAGVDESIATRVLTAQTQISAATPTAGPVADTTPRGRVTASLTELARVRREQRAG